MDELWQAFLLGNGAILGNVCLLPLYPGLIAYLAGREGGGGRARGLLGVFVLAGVLSLMLAVGALLWAAQASFGGLLPWLLPLVYVVVIALGALLLAGRNPFAAARVASVPALRNPYAGAWLYGAMLAPMTLPCTGPIVLSAFLVGAGDAALLADGIAFFLAFGLGFGWPLVLLPLLALPLQRRATGWLTRRHGLLIRLSGALLVGIGIFGIWTEVLPMVA